MSETLNDSARVPWWQVVLIGRNPWWTLLRIGVFVTLCFLGRQYVILPIRVSGISMLPTYKEGAVNFINRLAYARNEPQRGDVVAIRMAGEHVMLLKRIIGLPGEQIAFLRGKLMINGEFLDEPYLKLPSYWNMPPRQIGAGEYYVVGDNRSMAQVDHTQGIVSRSKIVGKAMR